FLCTVSSAPGCLPLTLHDALPIFGPHQIDRREAQGRQQLEGGEHGIDNVRVAVGLGASAAVAAIEGGLGQEPRRVESRVAVVAEDRKSTRLNSSHVKISYAVFCLK